jgi:pSer/pThr/pTyr-binding forkhead associated (FHA) protein
MTTGPRRFALRLRGSDILLPPGQLVMGRSAGCHVVLDDGMVSRRHAVLTITHGGASIEDLNSINGVYVNHERLARGPRKLEHGDQLLVGSTELEVVALEALPSLETSRADTLSGIDPVVPADADDDFDSLPNTRRIDALELLSTAVDRAYAAGRSDIVERLLADHLRDVLHDARSGRLPANAVLDTALQQSLRLAVATRRGAWFDFAIELLTACRLPPPEATLSELGELGNHLEQVNLPLFRQYLQTLAAELPRFDATQRRCVEAAQALYSTWLRTAAPGR